MQKLVLSVLLAASVAATALASDGRLLRFPTTNGTDVVFSYAGDLYKAPLGGGRAVRLTSHEGYEMFANGEHYGEIKRFKEGRQEGFAEGHEEGKQEGLVEGKREGIITGAVTTYRELGLKPAEILEKIRVRFHLSEGEAKNYIEQCLSIKLP